MEEWFGVHRELPGPDVVEPKGDQRVIETGVGDSSGAPWASRKPSESFRQGSVIRKMGLKDDLHIRGMQGCGWRLAHG